MDLTEKTLESREGYTAGGFSACGEDRVLLPNGQGGAA